MTRETNRGYEPEEEKKKKRAKTFRPVRFAQGRSEEFEGRQAQVRKPEVKEEMVEFLVETVEITSITPGLGLDSLVGAADLTEGVEKVNSLDLNRFQSVRETAEYARVYDRGLGKADEYARDKEKTEKKIGEIRDWLKGRKRRKVAIDKS